MSDSVIASFLVTPHTEIKASLRDLFLLDDRVLWSKALCRNPTAFPFLKRYLKKWLPYHLKWVSSYCSDIEFLTRYEARLDFVELSSNPHAIEILSRNLDRLDWEALSANPAAYEILKAHPDRVNWESASSNLCPKVVQMIPLSEIDWFELSTNPSACDILALHPDKAIHFAVNFNKGARELLLAHPEWIDYRLLSHNESKWAMEMVAQHLSQASFPALSSNEFAIDILLAHPDRIDWVMAKENARVGELYRVYPERIDWKRTCCYASMLPFIEQTPELTSSVSLALNPAIFEQDIKEYKERCKVIERLISKRKK